MNDHILTEAAETEADRLSIEAEIKRSHTRHRETHHSDHFMVFSVCGDFTHYDHLIASVSLMADTEIEIDYIGEHTMIGLIILPNATEAEITEADRLYSELQGVKR